jgi:WD40 repeat protein
VFSVAVSPDKALVASSELDDSLHLWNAKNGKSIAKHPLECVDAMDFSPDGKYLAATGGDETWLLETKDGTKVASFGCGSDLVFLDAKHLATGDRKDVVIWEL